MNERVGEFWRSYREVVDELYVDGDDGDLVLSPDASPDTLERLEARSDELLAILRGFLEGSVPRGEREELETAAYAAATVDVKIGSDVLTTFIDEEGPELGREVPLRPPPEGPPGAAGEEAEMSMETLLAAVGAVFGESERAIAGRAPAAIAAEGRVGNAIDELVNAGTKGASAFAGSILTAGAGTILGALGGLDLLRDLAAEIGGRLKHGMRLIELGLRKLAATVGADRLFELAFEVILMPLEMLLSGPAEPLSRRVVARLTRVNLSRSAAATALAERPAPPDPHDLEGALGKLCDDFDRNMIWAQRLGKWLGMAGGVLVVLGGGPAGQLAVAGVFTVGLVVCLFNLADRLDTTPEVLGGWLPGVPTIAADAP